MQNDRIRFTRQPDGTYTRSGELPKGTRHATVVSSAGPGLGTIKRVSEWLETIERGPLTKEWYEVIPAASPKAMSEEAKEKLRELNEAKRQEREVRD